MDETMMRDLESLENNIGPSVQDYPLNCWWVAARVDEVREKLLARTILGKRLVLFRASDGKPYAFMDRCPHRWAPISRGKVINDEVVCAYHGFRYNVKGECTLAPSVRHPPKALRIITYPAVELGPFVWVWIGDSAKADASILPVMNWRRQPDDVRVSGYRMTSCDFSLIHENIADTEHTLYLHGESFGNTPRIGFRSKVHGVMDVEPRRILFLSNARDMPPTKLDIALLGVEQNQGVNSSVEAAFVAPGCFSSGFEWTRSIQKPGAENKVKAFYLWCSTPISYNSCHFWWDLTFDHNVCNPREVEDLWAKALEEDIDICEAVQSSVDSRSERSATDALVAADRAVAAIRRMLKAMVKDSSAS